MRLVASQLLVALLLFLLAWFGARYLLRAQAELTDVYARGLVPLQHLGAVSRLLAVDFVDTVHKASDGAMSTEAASAELDQVRAHILREWHAAELGMTLDSQRAQLDALRPALDQALAAVDVAKGKMAEPNPVLLRRWRGVQMYQHVDPVTSRIQAQLATAIDETRAGLEDVQTQLRRAAVQGALGLGLVALIVVAVGVLIAARFLASLRRIEQVIRAGAEGDLSVRVNLTGRDELSMMASQLDHMLGALAATQAELGEQALKLARSESEARAASAAKTEFLGNVSHELRTPLNVIIGYAQVLRRDSSNPQEVERGLLRITEAGQHLLELIEDVLGVARLDAKALQLRPTVTNLDATFEELQRTLEPRAANKGLTFSVHFEGPLPKQVLVDRRRLMQVLLNLAGNAVKFTKRGGVDAYASWQQGELTVRVADTGPGMSAEELAALFQPFSQGTAGRKSGEGSGLGLHISQALVRMMGGELRVTSERGKGSAFTFNVRATETLEPPPAPRTRFTRAKPANVSVKRMLIVDDRATNREVLSALLRSAGFETLEADSGAKALELMETEAFSIVWLDLKMPEMDGFEVLRRLRTREVTTRQRTCVVAVTASLVDFNVEALLEQGFQGLVPKPLQEHQVMDTIEAQLGISLHVRASAPSEQTSLPPESLIQPQDLQWLDNEQRGALLNALTVGDLMEALTLVKAWGPQASALQKELEAFRAEPIRARLAAMAPLGSKGLG